MVVESGFRLALVPFDRPERAAGTSKNGVAALASFALSGLAGSAKSLLRLPLFLSLYTGLLSLVLLVASPVALSLGGPVWSVSALAPGFALGRAWCRG